MAALTFPSVDWFDAIRNMMNNDPEFRKLGTCDAEVGIEVRDTGQRFVLTFEAFECTGVREATQAELDATDFYLSMDLADWKEMIQNIKQNGGADLDHTLNTLDMAREDSLAHSKDEYRRDLFYRFNQTFQDFFNASAKLDTNFPN
ncbi:MAG TPA: hypothetical protein VNL92_05555 [Dehalococcoidia bacterium]|nr:hypothetical protein [Dehalococcoidia bacterium]